MVALADLERMHDRIQRDAAIGHDDGVLRGTSVRDHPLQRMTPAAGPVIDAAGFEHTRHRIPFVAVEGGPGRDVMDLLIHGQLSQAFRQKDKGDGCTPPSTKDIDGRKRAIDSNVGPDSARSGDLFGLGLVLDRRSSATHKFLAADRLALLIDALGPDQLVGSFSS